MPKEGLIIDAELSSQESLWSEDKRQVYTINWFKPSRVYSGSISLQDSVPVLSLGGAVEDGFVVVEHSHTAIS